MVAELLPVLVVMIQELRDARARDRLTHCLFNLVKKPTPEQRSLIMDGCVELASRIGPARTAEELLPQCWEQVSAFPREVAYGPSRDSALPCL